MAKKWILEIFRAGTQTDSAGNVKDWTESDLDKIVSKYSEGQHEAPLVIGHPKTDDPAFGWVKNVFREGKVLFAEVSEVAKEFREAVNQGFYKKRSISLYPDMTLKHIGFLGAMPPAVKGLADIKFNENDEAVFFEVAPQDGEQNFSDSYEEMWAFRSIGRVFRAFREMIIADKGQDAADKIVSNWEIQALENYKEPKSIDEEMKTRSIFSESNSKEGEPMTTQEKEEFDALKKQVATFSEALTAKEEEVKAEKARADAAEEKAAEAEKAKAEAAETAEVEAVKQYAEGLVKSGKLPAAELESEIETLNLLRKSGSAREFSENGETKTVSAFDARKGLLDSRKASVDFSEVSNSTKRANSSAKVQSMDFGDNELNAESLILHNKALAIQAAEGLSYSEAVNKARQ